MNYSELLENIKSNVTGITDDSRQVKSGFLFVALSDLASDGHNYIKDAIANGAKVIIGEKDLQFDQAEYVRVDDSRNALVELVLRWYDNPSAKLKVIGVTGTDGKTTTTNLIYQILKTAGKKVGLVSTISAQIGETSLDTGFHVTNPDSLKLQEYLYEMVNSGCEYAVLEVTSHGIKQKRTLGVVFETAVLTNITHEHLDYHKTFGDYRDTKLQLFKLAKNCVLNEDDESYEYFKSQLVDKNIKSYSLKKHQFLSDLSGIKLDDYSIPTLFGEYNASNILASIEVANIYEIPEADVKKALATFPQLPGRLEKIENDKGINIFVDFAHTPNSLKKVLTFLKSHTKGKLIAVYGCASERDEAKRKLMPEVSLKLADVSVFTAEDPRSEDINLILDQMGQNAESFGGIENKNFVKIAERGEAIYKAIAIAKPGDTVVICGKGHEKSMAYNGVEYPWSDQEAVLDAINGKVKEIAWKN